VNLTWFDIAVLSFLCWGGVGGYLQGITLSIYNMLGWAGALLVALYARAPLSLFVDQQYDLTPRLTEVISQRADLPMKVGGIISPGEGISGDIIYSWLAEALVNLLGFLAVFLVIASLLKIWEGVLLAKKGEVKGILENLVSSLFGVLKNSLVLFTLIYLILPFLKGADFLFFEDIGGSLTVTNISRLINIIF